MPKVSDAHLAARRRQILDAAAACFARAGFHRTSMQDIVRESGISAGLVYRYFAGKDDMIVAIVTEWHDQRRAPLRADDLIGNYLGLLRSIGDPGRRDDLRLGVQVWAEALRSSQILDLVRSGADGPRADAARALHGMTDLDPDALARVFVAIYQGLVLQTAWDETVDNAAVVDAVAAIVARLLPDSAGEELQ